MKRSQIKLRRLMAGWMLSVTLMISSSSGLVLCIGDGGHVAVEPVHHGHCDRGGNTNVRLHGDAALAGSGVDVDGAGGCVDVSLDLDNMLHVAKDVRHDRFLKNSTSKDLSADYVALASADDHRRLRPACETPPRLSHALLAQRTVVLRI